MTTADWTAIAGLAVILALVFAFLQRGPRPRLEEARPQIAIDGTNVLFWRGDGAQLVTLRQVVDHLGQSGFDPVVFLDASSRHHIGDKSLNEQRFAAALGVSQERVMVCPAGTEADAFILEYANAQKLPVVSNDQFRDRPKEVRNIKLIKGLFVGDSLILKGLDQV